MRLFVALELPAAARDQLAAWSARTLPTGWRTVLAPDLHLTLCFLGEWPEQETALITDALQRAVTGMPQIEIVFGAPLWLPPRRPRVLAVAVDGGTALERLQTRVAGSLAAGGWFVPERSPFLAHVTVARARGRELGPNRAALTPPAASRWSAAEVTLIRSRLGGGPARYERLATIMLRSAPG